MNCPRCGGMMISEWIPELQDEWKEERAYMVRCLSCGEMMDPLIVMNRKAFQSSRTN